MNNNLEEMFENAKKEASQNKYEKPLESYLFLPFLLFDFLNENEDENGLCNVTMEDICKKLNRREEAVDKLIENINKEENVIQFTENKIKLNKKIFQETIYGKKMGAITTLFTIIPSSLNWKNKEIMEFLNINDEKLIHTIRTLYKTEIHKEIKKEINKNTPPK